MTFGEQNILKLKPSLLDRFFWFYPAKIGLYFSFGKSSGKNKNVDILIAVSTDHLPVFCSLLNSTEFPKGPGIWNLIIPLHLIVTS